MRDAAAFSLRHARRVVIAVVGATLLALGLVLLLLPGPGVPVLFLALALLSIEFAWARVWMARAKQGARNVRNGAARYVPLLRQRDDT